LQLQFLLEDSSGTNTTSIIKWKPVVHPNVKLCSISHCAAHCSSLNLSFTIYMPLQAKLRHWPNLASMKELFENNKLSEFQPPKNFHSTITSNHVFWGLLDWKHWNSWNPTLLCSLMHKAFPKLPHYFLLSYYLSPPEMAWKHVYLGKKTLCLNLFYMESVSSNYVALTCSM